MISWSEKKIDSNARSYLDKHHWTPSSIHYTKRLWIACIQFMSSYFCHHSRTFEWKWNEKETFQDDYEGARYFLFIALLDFFLSNFNFNIHLWTFNLEGCVAILYILRMKM